jgi:hypothetical protein
MHTEVEGVLREHTGDSRGDPAPAGVRQDPVADLDDLALRDEMVEDAPPTASPVVVSSAVIGTGGRSP